MICLTCAYGQATEYIYLKKPVKVYSHSIEAVIFKGERVKAGKTNGGWLISDTFSMSQDGKLMRTDIQSIIPAGAVTGKNVHIKQGGRYIFTGSVVSDVAAKTLNQAVDDWADVYYERCSTCHKAYEAADYPCKRWPSIVDSMRVQAGLTPSEKRLILRYLQLKSRASKKR